MPNPLAAVDAFLTADVGNLPAGTTHSVTFPTKLAADHVHVQFAWDGTPSDADNREDAAVRFTVWTAKGKPVDAQDIAGGLRARLLSPAASYSSADVWRVNRGAGRLPGIDPDSKLSFCTFTVEFVMHALTAEEGGAAPSFPRIVTVDEAFTHDGDPTFTGPAISNVWTPDAEGDHWWVLVDSVDLTSYVVTSDPAGDVNTLGLLYAIVANDESVFPLATIPVGSIFVDAFDGTTRNDAAQAETILEYAGAGITLSPLGYGCVIGDLTTTWTISLAS